ncbi:MAG: serine hydrolase domain-containing protein, partial [Vulcanimicrobiaceae bacterium]
MQKELAVAALVAALALGRAVPGAAAEPLAVTPKIRTAVAGLAAQTLEKAPAGTVLELAIAEHGRLVDEETLVAGAHASPKKAATPTLGTGTIETLLTATLVMQLVAAGTLNLEEPVSTVLPNLPYGARITVGQLLSHRSGVADTIAEAIASGETARPTNTGALIAAIGAEQLAQPPDTTWAYSNAGYALLAAIVAATLHRPFAAVVDQKVFAPAGMRASSVGAPPKGAVLAAPLGGESFPDASWLYGCGDLFSNASDVARFDIALMDGTLLSLPQ